MHVSAAVGLERMAISTGPAKLDSITFDRLLRLQDPIRTGTFDLTATVFAAPSGLVNLGLAVEAAARETGDVTLRVWEPGLRTYFARCGFFAALSPSCHVEPDPSDVTHAFDHRIGRSPMLIELTRISDQQALEALLDRTIESVGRVREDRNDALDVAALLSELGGNLLEHGGGRGLLALQVYGEAEQSFLELAIGDLGPGIRASLHRNPHNPRLAHDLQAIQQAVRPMISGSTEPARGSGLYQLLRVTHEHSGSVQIRSGSAKARWRSDRPSGLGFEVPHLPGTQISFTLPAA
jgi:hypothetical protein